MVKNLPTMQDTKETWVQSLSQKDSLEKEMATIPVFLPGKSLGQRNLAGYSPWSHKKVGHDLATTQHQQTRLK